MSNTQNPRKIMKKLSCISLFILFLIGTKSTAQDNVGTTIQSIMENERRQEYRAIDDRALFLPENVARVPELLTPYFQDTLVNIRFRAYRLTHRAGQASDDAVVKQRVVNLLVDAVGDDDSGNSGAVMDMLTAYPAEAFATEARQKLTAYIHLRKSHLNKLFLLVGYVPASNTAARIRELLDAGALRAERVRWAAYLALARLGDTAAIDRVMNAAKSQPVNDDFIYGLAPDLVYTRQKEAINYLVEILNSDSPDCASADPDDSRKILCGYRLIEQLAPALKDYPYTLDPSGDLDVDDYREALQVVRRWFAEKGRGYEVEYGRY